MNFSGISDRSILGQLLRLPLRLIPKQTVLPVLQGPLRGARWVVGSATHGCWLGSYEHAKQAAFARRILPGWTVYDVGAHAGFYTLLSSRLVGPAGRVVAFEPFPPNLEHLRTHLVLNGAANVTVVESAVTSGSGEVGFDDQVPSSTMGRVAVGGRLRVPATSIDEFVANEAAPPPDAIKLDIEGGEADALRGAMATLRGRRPLVFLATHGPEVHAECLAVLTDLGFRLTSLTTRPVSTTDELMAE